ncbi:hypothetical protein QZH41_002043 [Actinostola sp. cb2023]|nr:hypothetical protein QZH41_002043 [Actinostola sp. cb2023]
MDFSGQVDANGTKELIDFYQDDLASPETMDTEVHIWRMRWEKIAGPDPLPDSSVHAIVVANAIHYFSTPEAYAEMCRVLVPGGMIGFFTKHPSYLKAPWMKEMLNECAKWYQYAGVSFDIDDNGEDFIGWGPALNKSGLFHEVQTTSVEESDPMNEEEALEHIMSYGGFYVCSETKRKELQERYKKVFHDHHSGIGKEMKVLPSKSFLYWAKKQ